MHQKASKMVQQILRSSKRVAKAREMLGLTKDEYVVGFRTGEVEIGNNKNKRTRIVREIDNQSACMFLVGKVMPYVQKEIVEYFDMPVNGLACVLMGNPRFQGHSFCADSTTRTIKIQFSERLNSKKLQHLFKKIKEFNYLWFDEGCHYEKTKPIKHFDEKFLIMREYEDLRKKYPTKIPEEPRENLILKTKKLLKIDEVYIAEDLRKTVSEFKKSLYG